MKTWFRLKDFTVIALPLLIISSLFLSLLQYFKIDAIINKLISPIVTLLLGLPEASGIVLLFGILRKELSMIMLFQAMHTTDLSTVMTNIQLIIFTVFIIFYMPCIATIGVLIKEVGIRKAIIITFLTIILAIFLSVVLRLILSII